MKGRIQVSHPQGHGEPWLITYSDMVTLLMSLFIVIVSVSKIDPIKAEEITQQFHKSTGAITKTQMPFHEIQRRIAQVIAKDHLQNQVQAKLTDQGVDLKFSSSVFFDNGQATVKPAALPLLASVGTVLGPISRTNVIINVEGHTDSQPIHTAQFPSNWELSTSRATEVVRFLIARGVSKTTLQAIGLADTHPMTDPRTHQPVPPADPRNRRVVIRIIREGS